MCPGWWQRLHFRGFLAVDSGFVELARGLLLLASGPWVLPLSPGQVRALKVPMGRMRGSLSLGQTHRRGRKSKSECLAEGGPTAFVWLSPLTGQVPFPPVNTQSVPTFRGPKATP